MNNKTSSTQPRQRLLVAAVAGLMAAASVPAMAADADVEALKRELAEQRKLIEQLLAERAADKKAQAAAPVAAVKPGQAAVTSTPNVTIYGILDGGVEHISNVAKTGGGTAGVTRVPAITASLPSRVGIRGNKEFAPGYAGIATAEMGFNTDDGSLGQGGRLFGRQLFAGVSTPYGTFTYGRQWSMLFYSMMASDLIGPNLYAFGSFDPYLANARYDNSLAWRGKFGNFSAGGLYSFARASSSGLIPTPGATGSVTSGAPTAGTCAGEVAGSSACRGWSVMAQYDDAAWGIAGAIDEQHGGPGAGNSFFNGKVYAGLGGPTPVSFPMTNSADTDRRTNLGGYVKFGDAKVGLGWLGRKVETSVPAIGTVKSNGYYLTGAYKLNNKITVDGGWNRMINTDQNRSATIVVARGFYNLGAGLDAYLQLGHIANSSTAAYSLSVGAGVSPLAGGSQTGTMAGMRYLF